MKTILAGAACVAFALGNVALAQEVNGTLTANGRTVQLKYAFAQEVDSVTEKGYMDVMVVLSDRKLGSIDARKIEQLDAMAREDGVTARVVRINPDAKIMSAEPLHPAFTTFASSAAFLLWKPRAFDEKRVPGRFWTDGTQKEFHQQWSYDVTFSAPIVLDPAAKTVPGK